MSVKNSGKTSVNLEVNADVARAIDRMRSDLIIVLINRLGGRVEISAEEIDGAGAFVMTMEIDPVIKMFGFQTFKKSEVGG